MESKVYDILDAGPRNRFLANGRIVHNCGQITQVQNYPSKGLLPVDETKIGIEALKLNAADIFGFDIMHLTKSTLRYTIKAEQGKKLLVADLAGIEGRILAWLAGEEWKLQAYREFDAGTGPDLYKLTYAKAFNVKPEEVTKDQRNQIGKPLDLSMGYHGGVSAFVTFATSYGVDVAVLAAQAKSSIPENTMREALNFYDWLRDQDITSAKKKAEKAEAAGDWRDYLEDKKTLGLNQEAFTVCDSLKRLWRAGHPATVKLWADAENACRNAVEIPNKDFYFGNNCRARRSGKWVRIILPSGHCLCYPGMEIHEDKLRFKGINQFTKKWGWIETFSGKIIENCTQGLARDVFKHGQLLAEENGYPVILPVHDELVCEVPDSEEYTVHGLEEMMATVPVWAPGLPLAAEGFEDYVYHK